MNNVTFIIFGYIGVVNHQTKLDVVGNNIANVNTVAYKASQPAFRIFSARR